MKQSFSLWAFHRKPLDVDELMRAAKKIGYDGVDLVPEEHWQRVRDHGLGIASTGGHGTLTDGMNKPSNHGRIKDEIAAKLEKAVEFEIPNLIVFSGNHVDGQSDEEGLENCAAILREVAPLAEKAGVNLAMELLNSKRDHAGYQCDRTEWGVRLCQVVGSPRVNLLYDIYHMQIMEGDVIATIRKYGADHFSHYHTAGNPGRKDLDEEQELYYPAIMRALKETGYTGYVGHEFIPKGDVIAALEAAYKTCKVD